MPAKNAMDHVHDQRNESDVANIDFELQAKKVTNSNVLHCLEIQRFAHISGTRCWIVIGFGYKLRI